MSFSNRAKIEICEAKSMPENCKAILLYGILQAARIYSEREIDFLSESPETAEYMSKLIGRLFHISVAYEQIFSSKMQKKDLYRVNISDKVFCADITESYISGRFAEPVCSIKDGEREIWSFVKGVFLGCGSISDPGREYHMEFFFQRKEAAEFTFDIFEFLGYYPKLIYRRGKPVIYFKDSETIEDMLTGMGAVKKSLELMDLKVIKDLRNRLNRRTNCETANIQRTVDVAIKQTEAINYIIAKRGMDFLPEDLQQVAYFRLDNPEMSLGVMAKEFAGEFSKSGLDRRLKKIVEISEEIKKSIKE